MFNAVGLARLDPAEAAERIEAMKATFDERGALAFWWVGARSEPPDLGRRLKAHGLTVFDVRWAGMALGLDGLDARRLAPAGGPAPPASPRFPQPAAGASARRLRPRRSSRLAPAASPPPSSTRPRWCCRS